MRGEDLGAAARQWPLLESACSYYTDYTERVLNHFGIAGRAALVKTRVEE